MRHVRVGWALATWLVAAAAGCDDDHQVGPRDAQVSTLEGGSPPDSAEGGRHVEDGNALTADGPQTQPDLTSSDAGLPDDEAAPVDAMSSDGPGVDAMPRGGAAAAFFKTEIVHRIEVTADPAMWQAFMAEHRSFSSPRMPTWFQANFVIDGTPLSNVAFRSFGWGSRDENKNKPNLSVDINRNVPGQTLAGVKRMRIKNNGQDVTGLRQAILYEAMRSLGLMAPRSTYAELFVNGEYLGVFFVEEHFNKDFVEEHTGNDNGAAYEPYGCQGFLMPAEEGACMKFPFFFSRSFNPMVGQGEELVALCHAMNSPPEQFLQAIEPHVLISEWIDQVAIDTALAGNRDGFSVTGSNFRLYHDTARNKIRLVILGPDDTFEPDRLPQPSFLRPEPRDNCARSNPSFRDIFLERLVATPQGLARYQQAVRRLRTGIMAADVVKQRVDSLWAIIGPRVLAEPLRVSYMEPEKRREQIKRYVDLRWAALEAGGF